jgi:hypothetical protein
MLPKNWSSYYESLEVSQRDRKRRTLYGQKTLSRADRPKATPGRDQKLASGASLPEVLRELEISEATYYRWRNRYDGMNLSETKRLKELEKENTRLKKIVAEQALDIQMLKEVSRKKF